MTTTINANIVNLDTSDTGTFTCTITMEDGNVFTDTQQLIVLGESQDYNSYLSGVL